MANYKCIDCVWRNSQVNECGMMYCAWLRRNVYGGSMPCPQFELYEEKTSAKRNLKSAVQ